MRLALVPFERQPRGKNAGARKKRAKAGLGGAFVLPVSGVAALSNCYSAASRYPAYLAPHGLHFYQAGEVLIYISLSYLYQAGEVLITHVPPRGVLDRCSSGDLGGCSVLRASVG